MPTCLDARPVTNAWSAAGSMAEIVTSKNWSPVDDNCPLCPIIQGARAGAKLDLCCLYGHVCRSVSGTAAVRFMFSGWRGFDVLLRHPKPNVPRNKRFPGRQDKYFSLHRHTANVPNQRARADDCGNSSGARPRASLHSACWALLAYRLNLIVLKMFSAVA